MSNIWLTFWGRIGEMFSPFPPSLVAFISCFSQLLEGFQEFQSHQVDITGRLLTAHPRADRIRRGRY